MIERIGSDMWAPGWWKGKRVITTRLVRQPPCAETDDGDPAPDVPDGTRGVVEEVEDDDEDDVRYWVRFDEPYGGVLLELEDFTRDTKGEVT